MTVGELIKLLGEHNPDLPVRLVVEDEFSRGPSVDAYALDRVVTAAGAHIEVYG